MMLFQWVRNKPAKSPQMGPRGFGVGAGDLTIIYFFAINNYCSFLIQAYYGE